MKGVIKMIKKSIKIIVLVLMCSLNLSFTAFADSNQDENLENQIYNHMQNRDTKFYFIYDKSSAIGLLQSAAKKDDYLERTISLYKTARLGNLYEANIEYRTNKEQEEFIDSELSKIVYNLIDSRMKQDEKVQAINEYLVKILKYDDTYKSDNVYSALTTGKTICQGYAMAAYKMFKLIGIECRIINGEKGSISHAWNLVKLENNWYHLDITNNDNIVRDRYLLKSDEFMKENDYKWNTEEYPKCAKNFYNVETERLDYENDDDKNFSQYYNGGIWYINDNKWYFLRLSGYIATGWIKYNDNWYYMNKNGEMQTGWIQDHGKWYYLWSDGTLAVNTEVNGYKVDENGVCV